MKFDPLGTLITQFAMLSLVAVGGATAVLPAMHEIAVTSHGWMTDQQFADLFAISNAAPGPNVLMVSLIGLRVAGVTGAVLALLAMCGPSCILSYWVVDFWDRFRDKPWRTLVQRALAPITIGLFLASGYVLCVAADTNLIAGAITVVALYIAYATRFNPLWTLAGAAVLGLVGIG